MRRGIAIALLTVVASTAVWLRRDGRGHGDGPAAPEAPALEAATAEDAAVFPASDRASVPTHSRSVRPRAIAGVFAPPVPSRPSTEMRRAETTASSMDFLADSRRPPEMSLQAWRAEKNALMDTLCSRRQPPGELAGILIAVSSDPEQDIVVRDYALQHMVSIYPSAVSDRGRIQESLFGALEEKQTSLPGTALLALNRLARDYSDVDLDMLKTNALALASDGDCGAMGRAAAMQVCVSLDATDVVTTARAIMNAPGSPFLRRSARAALKSMLEAHSELAVAIGTLTTQENCHDCP